MIKQNKLKLSLIIIIGMISISCASILIKLCEAPSLVIATYRLTIASLFYVILTKIKLGAIWSTISWPQRKVAFISGAFLALHFITWISSFKFTSVASSVVLAHTAPVFVAIGSLIFLREKPNIALILGIIITISGNILISFFDFAGDKNSLWGNMLAIGGAFGAAGYFVAGRKLRASVDTFRYVSIVYTVAAGLLLIILLVNGISLIGFNLKTYILLIAIAVVPQIIGHTVINWMLEIFSATTVSIIVLIEPIGASILAYFILSENLTIVKIIGGLIIIFGVVIVLLAETKQNKKTTNNIDMNER